MKIAIIGAGYVGLVTAACFADMGIDVTLIDIEREKIDALRNGQVTIYEPGLEEMIRKNHKAGRLHFNNGIEELGADTEIVFIAVGTPSDVDGRADLQYVISVSKEIGRYMQNYMVVTVKSTVPVGTSAIVRQTIEKELDRRGKHIEFDVASNPEFLKEGTAIKDFMSPDRVVVGVDSARARMIMSRLYKPFLVVSDRMFITDISSAEMIKYASNAMLATRISFMNDIANLCGKVGADINSVRKGIGSDTRIGNKFLFPGCGYGGSCFPKDVRALIKTAEEHGYEMRVLKAVEEVNSIQKQILFDKLSAYFDENLKGLNVAIWGLSYKPETDDMREAPSLTLIQKLIAAGINVRVYDPVAMNKCRQITGDSIYYAKDKYDALNNVDALLLVTEWKEFRLPDFALMKKLMRGNVIFDGRNILDREELRYNGFVGFCIG